MTRALVRSVVVPFVAGALLVARPSAAQLAAGLDASAVDRTGTAKWGAAIDARFGYRTGLPRAAILHSLIIQPEAIGGYRRLFAAGADGGAGWIGGGLRLGLLLGWLEPFAFGHLGAVETSGDWGTQWDVGAALDWRVGEYNFGAHYAHTWQLVASSHDVFDEFGVHAEVRWFCP